MASLSLAINYAISGYSVWSYHLFNLIIHILAGLTLYGIIRRTLLSKQLKDRFGSHAVIISWTVSAIWLVHPIQTESITYIIQRTESLMGLFYLLTLYSAIGAMESSGKSLWPVVSVVCCGLGMGTKEVMVTAPILVLLYDRAFFVGSFASALRHRRGLYAGLAASWIILIAVMSTGPRSSSAGFGLDKITPWQYAGTQFGVIVHYLRLSFWPSGLCLDYSWPVTEKWPQIIPPMLFIVFLLAVTFWGLFRNYPWSYPAAWLFFILFPTSSFVPITDLAFEHRMYLPLAGLVTLLVMSGYMAAEYSAKQFRIYWAYYIAFMPAVGIIIALTCVTVNRNKDYHSALSIWENVLKVSPDNARAHNNMGIALRLQGRLDEAMSHYRRSIQLAPDYADVHNNIGALLQFQGRLDEAVDYYNKALHIDPNYSKACNNLGIIMAMQGRFDEAVSYFRKAISLNRDYAEAYSNLGNALTSQGKFGEAINYYQQSLQIKPNQVIPLTRLAAAYAADGQFEQAEETAQKALELASALKQDELINRIREQLELYRQKKPSSL